MCSTFCAVDTRAAFFWLLANGVGEGCGDKRVSGSEGCEEGKGDRRGDGAARGTWHASFFLNPTGSRSRASATYLRHTGEGGRGRGRELT